jgi:prepilin-type N-terminal cleavage/methylation domain-containing protein
MTPHTQALSQPNAGFTLVEVLVSMTILSVASLALGPMLVRSGNGNPLKTQ